MHKKRLSLKRAYFLVFAGLIEMVVFYQTMGAGNSIRKYNRDYASGNNQLGIMQIVDGDGQVRFATEKAPQMSGI